ncbi:hypothetical protein HaLaN_13919 [Haematococcus lacustris]|uniref:Uncharacterized protein n=1 Tax=Haematococcus lacustris TaxID=44745 RepID=A0A699Z5E2_HAELA|nr:hypothetical protein HaLaN_13919 [Haematococcus lacustris]
MPWRVGAAEVSSSQLSIRTPAELAYLSCPTFVLLLVLLLPLGLLLGGCGAPASYPHPGTAGRARASGRPPQRAVPGRVHDSSSFNCCKDVWVPEHRSGTGPQREGYWERAGTAASVLPA